MSFASWIMKSLTNGAIPYTMIYRVSSACIEYPAAILESGKYSLNLSDSLSVDQNDWLLLTTYTAGIISTLAINCCKFIWSCRSDLETVMLTVWLQSSVAWLFDSFTAFWCLADFLCCLTFSLPFYFTETLLISEVRAYTRHWKMENHNKQKFSFPKIQQKSRKIV